MERARRPRATALRFAESARGHGGSVARGSWVTLAARGPVAWRSAADWLTCWHAGLLRLAGLLAGLLASLQQLRRACTQSNAPRRTARRGPVMPQSSA
jgi:hypothetical protein